MNTLAAGYVFGGWNFGPEGALFDYYQSVFADDKILIMIVLLTLNSTLEENTE